MKHSKALGIVLFKITGKQNSSGGSFFASDFSFGED